MQEIKPPITTVTKTQKTIGDEEDEHPVTIANIAIIGLVVGVSTPTLLLVGHALPLLDNFFNGMKPLVGYLGFFTGIALIALVVLSIWYVHDRFRVDINRRLIRARKFQVDAQSGNYDAYLDTNKSFLIPKPGITVPQVPQTYAPQLHFINKASTKKEEGEVIGSLLIESGNVQKPSVEELVSKIEHNSLQVCLGRSLTTSQQYLTADITTSHSKIIGTSQFGKSCEAAAIMAQVEMTHDPERLQIALLDMENRVSRLFEKSPHVARIGIGRGNIGLMHARSLEEVPIYLHYLAQELERRSAMETHDVEQLPHILIYFEEFLYVKKALKLEGGKTCAQFLLDFDAIAARGLKLGLHLMCCTQTDYADDDLKDAKAQFKTRLAFYVPPSTASSAGFVHHDLIKQNFISGTPGHFVVEMPGTADLGVAPEYDLKAKLKSLHEAKYATKVLIRETKVLSPESRLQEDSNQLGKQDETTPEAIVAELEGETWPIEQFAWKLDQLIALLHETQDEQYKKIWEVTPGSGREYKRARAERIAIVRYAQSLLCTNQEKR